MSKRIILLLYTKIVLTSHQWSVGVIWRCKLNVNDVHDVTHCVIRSVEAWSDVTVT